MDLAYHPDPCSRVDHLLARQWNTSPGLSRTPSREMSGRYSMPPWRIDAGLWTIGDIPNNARSLAHRPSSTE